MLNRTILAASCLALSFCFHSRPVTAADDAVTLEPVADFLQLPKTLKLGQCSAVAIDSKGQIYVFHRGPQPILCFDADGKFVRSWGDKLIGIAHGLRVDKDDNVWVTDIGRHVVMKFDSQGKLLLTLGRRDKPGTATDQFDKPTDVAFGSGGEVYVSDGYGNSRVMKFAADGKFIKTWGQAGSAPGELRLPHAIRVDGEGRVYVGDRENDRVQVFDGEGKLLQVWPGFAPFGLAFAPGGTMFVADGRANKIHRLDERGHVVQSWGQKGAAPGEFSMPHGIHVDPAGNVLVAEVNGLRVQKLKRSPAF
jgi:DNA-binding beta-propeller fold protein YncE